MTKAKITGTELKITEREPLLAGSVDLNKIEFSFSGEWSGLIKQIDFTNEQSGQSRRISAQMQVCTVPWELLRTEGDINCYIRGIGADGKLKMRTNEANLGTVLGSAQDDVPGSASPTPEVCDELAAKIGEPTELETEAKDNLVAAVNEVKHTADSKQDKLIAGDNITIAADGKTISATGGGSSYDDTELRQRIGDIEAKESTWDAKSNFSGSYNDLTDKPTIPDSVTEGTVSGWGFTKNTGTYSKPTDGIPKADLANDVQNSLSKAETALQSVSTDNIDALAVTNAKIANGAVSTGKIARGAVTEEKISTALLDKIDGMQPKTITDTAGYYTTDTVEGALAEIGGTLDGLEAAINTIRGIS